MRFPTPTPEFARAAPEDAARRRRVIRGIKQLTGKHRQWRLYAEYSRTPAAADVFAAAVERLALTDHLCSRTRATQRANVTSFAPPSSRR